MHRAGSAQEQLVVRQFVTKSLGESGGLGDCQHKKSMVIWKRFTVKRAKRAQERCLRVHLEWSRLAPGMKYDGEFVKRNADYECNKDSNVEAV